VAAALEQGEALADVDEGADERGAGAERAEGEGLLVAELEEHGADGEQGEEGAGLAGPVGPNVDRNLEVTQDGVAAEEQGVAADDDGSRRE